MKNLFLEGFPRTGKTSLILKLLGERTAQAGGFSTVRLRCPDGTIAGYRVKRASEMTCSDEDYSESLTDVFLLFTPQNRVKDEQTFIRFASRALADSSDKPFILMDEFGGIEITDSDFCAVLRNKIASDTPIIGVLKSRHNSEKMSQSFSLGEDYMQAYDSLRSFIESTDSVILNLQELGTDRVTEMILRWLHENDLYQ